MKPKTICFILGHDWEDDIPRYNQGEADRTKHTCARCGEIVADPREHLPTRPSWHEVFGRGARD